MHASVLSDLEDDVASCDGDKTAKILMLFTDFDIDDVTLAAFTAELEQEFEAAVAAGLITMPNVVTPTIPPIPVGSEATVADLRASIEAAARSLEKCRDFNEFAGGFVCERATTEIMAAITAADAELVADRAEKETELQTLFMLEGAPGESFDAFCADLMAEFRASLMGGATPTPTNPATTMLPIDVVPAGCTSAQTKHTELEAKLAEINELAALRDFVAPRVANADKMAALCGGKKELLEGIVTTNFPAWTMGIQAKIDILAMLYPAKRITITEPSGAVRDESWPEFLIRFRAMYDARKDDDAVLIVSPGFTVDPVYENCPDPVLDAYAVAAAFRDVVEDCLSYTAWLEAE